MPHNPLALDNQLCFAVYRAQLAFSRAYRPLLAKLGLTYPQYLVMLVLWERHQVRVSEIGEALALDSGTLSPLIQRLEKMELVHRMRDETDQRAVNVRLTHKGIAARKVALDVADGIGVAVGCSAEEFLAIRDQIRALTERLEAKAATNDLAVETSAR